MFKVIVKQTDTYYKEFTLDAESAEQAEEIVYRGLEACPLDTTSNAFEGSEIIINAEEICD